MTGQAESHTTPPWERQGSLIVLIHLPTGFFPSASSSRGRLFSGLQCETRSVAFLTKPACVLCVVCFRPVGLSEANTLLARYRGMQPRSAVPKDCLAFSLRFAAVPVASGALALDSSESEWHRQQHQTTAIPLDQVRDAGSDRSQCRARVGIGL